jgi:bifunctional DNA-binding transcriptional regulator/antitoxin component of YhaV-PrlF toxin-antitoxin module
MSIARVRERGQLTLPLAVRVALGASTGSDLLFIPTGAGLFTVQRLERPELLLDLLDHFTGDGPAPDLRAFQPGMGDGWSAPFVPEEAK